MIFWKNWKWWCDMVFIWLKIFEIFLSARKTAFVSTTTTIIIIHARIMTYLLLIIFVGISKQEKNSSCIPILRFIRAKKINKCDYWRNISGQCSFLKTQQKALWFWAQLYTSLMEYYLFQCMQGGFAFSKCLIRAIFDLSNKIALLILLRMFALKVKKKQKIEEWLKSDIFSSV